MIPNPPAGRDRPPGCCAGREPHRSWSDRSWIWSSTFGEVDDLRGSTSRSVGLPGCQHASLPFHRRSQTWRACTDLVERVERQEFIRLTSTNIISEMRRLDRVEHRTGLGGRDLPTVYYAAQPRPSAAVSVNDHAQRAWLWPAPQSVALVVGKAPLGPCLSSERPNIRKLSKSRIRSSSCPTGLSPEEVPIAFNSTPDRQSLLGSHGQRPWVYLV